MPGDPDQCRLNAARCLALAQCARSPERRKTLTAMVETWIKLAAEIESDQVLLRALYELDFSEPRDALPLALGLRSGAA
jgi:hypothetical protein